MSGAGPLSDIYSYVPFYSCHLLTVSSQGEKSLWCYFLRQSHSIDEALPTPLTPQLSLAVKFRLTKTLGSWQS